MNNTFRKTILVIGCGFMLVALATTAMSQTHMERKKDGTIIKKEILHEDDYSSRCVLYRKSVKEDKNWEESFVLAAPSYWSVSEEKYLFSNPPLLVY